MLMAIKLSFEDLGGKIMLEKISKSFYDKVYADSWIGLYFKDVPQNVIESQQVDFMMAALGGPNQYCGKLPVEAHSHMMITEELFDVRQKYLNEAMKEVGAHPELIARWLKIDEAFRARLVKKSEADCKPRYASEPIMNFTKRAG